MSEKSEITKLMNTVEEVDNFSPGAAKRLNSATHEEILAGATSDIYFIKTQDILQKMHKEDTVVTAEIFARRPGLFVGIEEVMALLADKPLEVWALPEASEMSPKEVVCRITGKYADFGVYETAILGILASSSGWATAARLHLLWKGQRLSAAAMLVAAFWELSFWGNTRQALRLMRCF